MNRDYQPFAWFPAENQYSTPNNWGPLEYLTSVSAIKPSPKQRTERFQMAIKQIGIVTGKHPREDEVEKNHQNKLDLLSPTPWFNHWLPSSLDPSQTLLSPGSHIVKLVSFFYGTTWLCVWSGTWQIWLFKNEKLQLVSFHYIIIYNLWWKCSSHLGHWFGTMYLF